MVDMQIESIRKHSLLIMEWCVYCLLLYCVCIIERMKIMDCTADRTCRTNTH